MKKTTTPLVAKRIAIAVAAVCASLSLPVAANDTKAMLDLMLKKGVITQKDYDEFIEANKDADENKAFKDARIDKDVSKSITFIQKRANDGNVKPSGFGFVSGDGKSEINLVGRLHFDARHFDSPFKDQAASDNDGRNFGNQLDLRRARIGVQGKFLNDFNFEMVWNGTSALDVGPSTTSTNIDTAWINYSAVKEAQVRVGRYKQPFNLEDYGTSSNNIDFIERSYVNQVSFPGKRPGMMLWGIPSDGTTYAVSLFQDQQNQGSNSGNLQVAGRVATDLGKLSQFKWNDKFLHIGLAGIAGKYDIPTTGGNSNVLLDGSIRSEARGVNAFNARIATGAGDNLSQVSKNTVGYELAYGQGPLKFQSEYAVAQLDAWDNQDARTEMRGKIKTSYIAVLYNLTGENWYDSYKDGAFSSVKIKNNFDPNGSGIGAWQVGLRFSTYDASDLLSTVGCANATCRRGSDKGNTTTVGLNWFINPNARMMLNHSITRFDTPLRGDYLSIGPAGALGDTERVTTLRAQYNF
jgi:phosphate-selective porin OprO/OprP